MIGRLKAFFSAPAAQAVGADAVLRDGQSRATLQAGLQALNRDPFLWIAEDGLGLISVFDDLKYDRADADMLSPAMRAHAIAKLAPLGFRQTSGTVLTHKPADMRVIIPKVHALGASPFDVARYTPKRAQDFYLLTPTQTACQFIDGFAKDEAVERIKELIASQPINLLKLEDYLERKDHHRDFLSAIGHLKYVQREAVASEALCHRRALGSVTL